MLAWLGWPHHARSSAKKPPPRVAKGKDPLELLAELHEQLRCLWKGWLEAQDLGAEPGLLDRAMLEAASDPGPRYKGPDTGYGWEFYSATSGDTGSDTEDNSCLRGAAKWVGSFASLGLQVWFG